MSHLFRDTVLDCLLDLGVTVVYAALAGLVIVAVVASDSGPISVVKAAAYASLLPGAVVLLIGIDIGLRLVGELRRRHRTDAARLEEDSLSAVLRTE